MGGLYVHIPFCVRKCAYCDFYSVPAGTKPTGTVLRPYVEAVLAEAARHRGSAFETLYLGGGTPSLLGDVPPGPPGGGLLTGLLDGLARSFDLSALTEATIEMNPESAHRGFVQAARGAGIDRVSIGVQSLSDAALASVGRVHTASQAIGAVELALHSGFRSVSADVMVGLPGQTWPVLKDTLEALSRRGIQHISAYCLSLEEGTPLAAAPPADLPSDEAQADLFELARAYLSERGFGHYEISNFALPGHECRHNLNYWRGGDYLGLGPAAASHILGRRSRNRADLEAYMADPGGQVECVEHLGPAEKAAEEAILRLRLLQEGLDTAALSDKFGPDNTAALMARLERLAAAGALHARGATYHLPEERVLTSNPILADVLGD